jgi:hypothetical protein
MPRESGGTPPLPAPPRAARVTPGRHATRRSRARRISIALSHVAQVALASAAHGGAPAGAASSPLRAGSAVSVAGAHPATPVGHGVPDPPSPGLLMAGTVALWGALSVRRRCRVG